MNFNKAIIAGNLTADPEKRVTEGGTTVVNFSVATNRFYSDSSGERKQDAEFHNVVFFGKVAENIAQYLSKGSMVLLEGRIQTRSWDDQDGKTRYRTEIIGQTIQFGPRDQYQEKTNNKTPKNNPKKEKNEEIPVIEEDEDINVEDIPF